MFTNGFCQHLTDCKCQNCLKILKSKICAGTKALTVVSCDERRNLLKVSVYDVKVLETWKNVKPECDSNQIAISPEYFVCFKRNICSIPSNLRENPFKHP